MNDSAALLRLLEPAVRPVSTTPVGPSVATPFESQSFEQLLMQAQTKQPIPPAHAAPVAPPSKPPETERADEPTKPTPAATFEALTGVDRIENPTLRQIIAQA